jgi:hypothetical protein
LGIDPGISTGLAALDLDGEFLFARSEKEIRLDNIVQETSSYGKVVLVATDVTPAPDLVRRVASIFNAALFVPRKSMESSEKRMLVSRYGLSRDIDVSDSHARDALASGIKALNKFKNKFEKLESYLAEKSRNSSLQQTKELVVRGFSINRAISDSHTKHTPKEGTIPHIIRSDTILELKKTLDEKTEVIRRLDRLVQSLQDELDNLKSENDGLRSLIEKERARYDIEIRKDRIVKVQENRITDLKKRVRELENKIEVEERTRLRDQAESKIDSNLTLLKPVESFSAEGLERAARLHQISPGDVVFLKNASGGGASTSRKLARLRPRIVITSTAMSDQAEETLSKYAIPVLRANHVSITEINGFLYVSKRELEAALSSQRSNSNETIESMLERAVEDYREED